MNSLLPEFGLVGVLEFVGLVGVLEFVFMEGLMERVEHFLDTASPFPGSGHGLKRV